MIEIHIPVDDVYFQLACDAALLEGYGLPPEGCIRIYEVSSPYVVMGLGSRCDAEVDRVRCLQKGIPLARRHSGGGTVVVDGGCIMFSVVTTITDETETVENSYRHILGGMAVMFDEILGGSVSLEGISDLAWGGRKFSGNAQRRSKNRLLHQGTILYAMNLETINECLLEPPRPPAYRQGRSHTEFLCNIPLNANEVAETIRRCFGVEERTDPPPELLSRASEIAHNLFRRREWVFRR